MKIKTKIIALVGIPIAGILILLAVGWIGMLDLEKSREVFYQQNFILIVNEKIPDLQKKQNAIALILNADRDAHQAVIAERLAILAALEASDDNYKKADKDNLENIDQISQRVSLAATDFQGKELKALHQTFLTLFEDWKTASRKVVSYAIDPQGMKLAPKISNGTAKSAFDKMRDQLDKMEGILEKQIENDLEGVKQTKENAILHNTELTLRSQNTIVTFILIVLVFTLVAIVSALLISRMITRPLAAVLQNITHVHKTGDLSQRVSYLGNDEVGMMSQAIDLLIESLEQTVNEVTQIIKNLSVGDLTLRVEGDATILKDDLNQSIDMLSEIISEIRCSSEKSKNSAVELTHSSQAMANGASKQASSLEEIASSIVEIGSQTKINSDNANQALQLTTGTLEALERGNSQMQEMLTSMNEINSTSNNVSKVIKVIEEIAFQTNLLALNAAVEAARAGKYGKGFAVVAEEVRSLAARSTEAAKSSTQLIVNSTMEVCRGVENANKTAEILLEIDNNVQQVSDVVGKIASASKEQALGIEEVNTGLSQVNQVIQSNSAISEETSSASSELSAQADHLAYLIARFKLDSTQVQTQVIPKKSPGHNSTLTYPPKSRQATEVVKWETPRTILLEDGSGERF